MHIDTSAGFVVSYDGDALRDHEIDVRDLAPALLAIGKLFEDANRIVNGDRAEVRVNLKATAAGSVDVHLSVAQSLGSQIIGLLTSDKVQAATNLKDLIGMGSTAALGLLGVLKILKGRKAKKISEAEGQTTISVDNETLVVPNEVVKLMENVAVRDDVEAVLAPLKNAGIDSFKARDEVGAVPAVEITKEHLAYFSSPKHEESEREVLPDRTWTSAYTIISPVFKDDNKWRLSDGHATISATILDKEFLKQVDNRAIFFGKGDAMVCEMRLRQTHGSDGLRAEYEVVRVVEYRPAPRQIKLFE